MSFSLRSRYRLIMWIVTLLAGVVMGLGIVFIVERPTFDRINVLQIVPTALHGAAVSTSEPTHPTAASSGAAVIVTSTTLAATTSPPTLTRATAPATTAKPADSEIALSPANSQLPRTATLTPTSTVISTTAIPTTSATMAHTILQRVSAAETSLRTGEFETTLDYGNGSRSSSLVRFDLGGASTAARVHMTTIYSSTDNIQTVERITIGDQAWQRQADKLWSTVNDPQDARSQLQSLLPHAARIADAELERTGNRAILRWHPATDAEMTLTVDLDTGRPRELHLVVRGSGAALTVIYRAWNAPVDIQAPTSS